MSSPEVQDHEGGESAEASADSEMLPEASQQLGQGKWREAIGQSVLAICRAIHESPESYSPVWLKRIWATRAEAEKAATREFNDTRGARIEVLDALRQAFRYISFVLADYGQHRHAFGAALNNNKAITKKRWHLGHKSRIWAVVGAVHWWTSNFSTSWFAFAYRTVAPLWVLFAVADFLLLRAGQVLGQNGHPASATWPAAFYFGAVTMTTLGYGDLHPNVDCVAALIVSIVQAFSGYVLLAVFVSLLIQYAGAHPLMPRDWGDWYEKTALGGQSTRGPVDRGDGGQGQG